MLILWIVNDHVLKELYGNIWTGKLSDIAGLVVFPLFLFALYEVFVETARPRQALSICIAAAGLFFIGLNSVESFSNAVCYLIGGLQWPFKALVGLTRGTGIPPFIPTTATPDVTDLYTLPALGLAWRVGRAELRSSEISQHSDNSAR